MSLKELAHPQWLAGDGPEADVVISTRARLARGITGIPYPWRASERELAAIVDEVLQATDGLSERFGNTITYFIDDLDAEEKCYLLDAHIASFDQLNAGKYRAIILEPTAKMSIMINEEDHLRIQSLAAGLDCEECYETVDWTDSVLSESLDFGFSPKYGYLTASISNAGTGLRVSSLMHLAGLSMTGELKDQLIAAYDLGVSIRGLFGEGSRLIGDMFQVSNEVTLGINEQEIVQRVRSVTRYLLEEERRARKELDGPGLNRLLEKASVNLDRLKSKMAITAEEAIAFISPVRLAFELDMVEGATRQKFNELLVGIRVAAGQDCFANVDRATHIRRTLADVLVRD